jgi:hypothetical protein
MKRRDVVKAVTLGGAAVASGGVSGATSPRPGKVVHQVFFWLKAPGSTADRDRLIAGLRTLETIPVVRSLQVGVPASTERREVVDATFDVSELMVFDSVADQKLYQEHPVHQDFIANCSHLWGKVIVYDTLTV